MRLIKKNDVGKYREVSRSVRDDKINPFIEDAQFLDLRPLLGDDLYYDILKDDVRSDEDKKYEELLEGGSYEVDNNSFYNPGLKKVLAIYAYARYILFGSFTDTAFGFVQKSNQDSKPVGDAQKRNIHTKEQNTAFNYWVEVTKFLDRNRSDFPLWKTNNCGIRTGKKIRISKMN